MIVSFWKGSRLLFVFSHGATMVLLIFLLAYADNRSNELLLLSLQLPVVLGWMFIGVIAAELLIVRLSAIAGERLGKLIRTAWALMLLPLAVVVIADFRLFRALGSHFDSEVIGYAFANIEGVAPLVVAEIDAVVITGLAAVAVLVVVLSIVGWRTQDQRGRRLGGTVGALLVLFAVMTVVTARVVQTCSGNTRQSNTVAASYILSSFARVAGTITGCPSVEAQSNEGTQRAKLAVLQASVSDNAAFFENMDRVITTPVKLKQTSDSKPDNVVVIALESFRTDAVTPYASHLDTTPFLDKLATEGLKAETAFADFFHSSKSLVAINCGMPPHPFYDIAETGEHGLPYECLPALLKPFGYASAFFQTATTHFENRHDLAANMQFDHFSPREAIDSTGWEEVNALGIEDRAMIKPMMAWVDEQPGPFLLSMITVTSHYPYRTPSTFARKQYDGTEYWNAYLNSIRYTDAFLQEVFAEFDRRGLLDNTLFVLTGDHGVGVGEFSSRYPYPENIKVPLIVWSKHLLPKPAVISGPRQHNDIVPTIVDLLDLELAEGSFYGRSLLADADNRILYIACKLNDCQVLIDRGFMLINHFDVAQKTTTPAFYDLKDRPRVDTSLLHYLSAEVIKTYTDQLSTWRQKVFELYGTALSEE